MEGAHFGGGAECAQRSLAKIRALELKLWGGETDWRSLKQSVAFANVTYANGGDEGTSDIRTNDRLQSERSATVADYVFDDSDGHLRHVVSTHQFTVRLSCLLSQDTFCVSASPLLIDQRMLYRLVSHLSSLEHLKGAL